jgi:hypothetical protein
MFRYEIMCWNVGVGKIHDGVFIYLYADSLADAIEKAQKAVKRDEYKVQIMRELVNEKYWYCSIHCTDKKNEYINIQLCAYTEDEAIERAKMLTGKPICTLTKMEAI